MADTGRSTESHGLPEEHDSPFGSSQGFASGSIHKRAPKRSAEAIMSTKRNIHFQKSTLNPLEPCQRDGTDIKKRHSHHQSYYFMVAGLFIVLVLSYFVSSHLLLGSGEKHVADVNVFRGDSNTSGANPSPVSLESKNLRRAYSCPIYFAPSSIPGGGMGIYTAKSLKQGESFMPYPNAPSIPIIDPDSDHDWVKLFQNYWYESGKSEATVYEATYAVDFQVGMGSLPNSHPYLNNLGFRFPKIVPYDDTIMNRASDPGAGANTYYMGRIAMAAADVEAGEELFLRYPTSYMKHMSRKYNIPEREDYKEAGRIVNDLYLKFGKDFGDWEKVATHNYSSLSLSDKITSILPKTQSDLDRVLQTARKISKDQAPSKSDTALAIAKELSVQRHSVEWIKENGVCLDNVKPGKSSNPRAGNGAIANLAIEKGKVIAPAPVLQMTNREELRITDDDDDGEKEGVTETRVGDGQWQLLLNYCFGHESSSLLLCPLTNVALINHCSKRRPDLHPCGKKSNVRSKRGRNPGPNARLRWASWDKVSNGWLEKSIIDMEKEYDRKIGLHLEIVAERNIKEGEEIFIDYGINWENAWDEHMKKWNLYRHDSDLPYSTESIADLNNKLHPLPIAPNFDPVNISTGRNRGLLYTGCAYWERDTSFWDGFESDVAWKEMPSKKILRTYSERHEERDAIDEEDSLEDKFSDGVFWPCVIVGKDEDKELYTVRIIQSKAKPKTKWYKKGLPRIIRHFPRGSIRHFYVPYQSDVHLPNAFRYPIELDDAIFPDNWKNAN